MRLLVLPLLLALLGCSSDVVVPSQAPACPRVDVCSVEEFDPATPCDRIAVPGCALCDGGSTRPGLSCCKGCWAGGTCIATPDSTACGAAGGLCAPCFTAQKCVNGVCGF